MSKLLQQRAVVALGLIVWGLLIAGGMWGQWKYEAASGATAKAPMDWPAGSQVKRPGDMPILVMSIHPHCPCSRATIDELAKLMTHCQGKLATIVLMIRPDGVADAWEHTDLWNSAAMIPGVSVRLDPSGHESSLFGAVTSGQALLYSAGGKLLFSGGITESRGHSGDNAGRSLIESLVRGEIAPPANSPVPHTAVYGCPLFSGPVLSPASAPASFSPDAWNSRCNQCRK